MMTSSGQVEDFPGILLSLDMIQRIYLKEGGPSGRRKQFRVANKLNWRAKTFYDSRYGVSPREYLVQTSQHEHHWAIRSQWTMVI